MKKKAPQCQICHTTYLWDWDQDAYRTEDGRFAATRVCRVRRATLRSVMKDYGMVVNEQDSWYKPRWSVREVTAFHCVGRCESLLGMMVSHPDIGAIVLQRKDWKSWQNVDWEQAGYTNPVRGGKRS